MRIGYITEGGMREYDMEQGDLVIIVDMQEAVLQEYLIGTLIEAAEGDDEKLSLQEVNKYVVVNYDTLTS